MKHFFGALTLVLFSFSAVAEVNLKTYCVYFRCSVNKFSVARYSTNTKDFPRHASWGEQYEIKASSETLALNIGFEKYRKTSFFKIKCSNGASGFAIEKKTEKCGDPIKELDLSQKASRDSVPAIDTLKIQTPILETKVKKKNPRTASIPKTQTKQKLEIKNSNSHLHSEYKDSYSHRPLTKEEIEVFKKAPKTPTVSRVFKPSEDLLIVTSDRPIVRPKIKKVKIKKPIEYFLSKRIPPQNDEYLMQPDKTFVENDDENASFYCVYLRCTQPVIHFFDEKLVSRNKEDFPQKPSLGLLFAVLADNPYIAIDRGFKEYIATAKNREFAFAEKSCKPLYVAAYASLMTSGGCYTPDSSFAVDALLENKKVKVLTAPSKKNTNSAPDVK